MHGCLYTEFSVSCGEQVSPAALERFQWSSGNGRRGGFWSGVQVTGRRGGRSRRGRERGKAAGVATGEPATGSDPGEWSCSDDESPEAAVSAEPSRLRPQRVAGAAVGAEHRSGGRSRSCYPSRPWPASGRCGVPPLEWGGRDAVRPRGKPFPRKSKRRQLLTRGLTTAL